MAGTVLIVDDDRPLRKLIRAYLQEAGVAVVEAANGEDALVAVRARRPDLVLLDVRLPGIDGFETLRRIASDDRPVPVIMLTSADDELDQLVGYRIGAVDYVTKPISPKVLAAKVTAFLGRLAPNAAARVVECGSLRIELDAHRVMVADAMVPLTRREYDLLAALAVHPGWVYDRDHLLREVWQHDATDLPTRVVDQHVANLRRKLEAAGATDVVETVRGVGYRLLDGS